MAATKLFDDPNRRKALLKLARTKPVAFAIVLGSKPSEAVLGLDKLLGPDKIFKGLRKESGLTRGTWGTVEIDGRVATFTCEKPITSITRTLRILLKAEKLPYVPLVPGDDDPGEEADGDEIEATDGSTDTASDAPPTAPAVGPLRAALNAMTPAIKSAVAADPAAKAEILKAVASARTAMDSGDVAAAKAGLLDLGGLLKKAGSGSDPGDIRPAIAAWRTASESVDSQIGALQQALRGTGDADFQRIAEFGLNGITGRHRVSLQASLMDLEQASGKEQVGRARAAAEAYRGFLETDRIVGLVDENPFVSTTIRSTLTGALASLEGALAKAG